MTESVPAVELKALRKDFRVSGGNSLFPRMFTAVEDVSLRIMPGETFGIVGESGCGKSTVARLIMGLEKPTAGEVWFAGQRTDTMPEKQLRAIRPRFQMVFQDSGSSLNPRKRVREILTEPMRYHRTVSDPEARVDELMEMVGLPAEMKDRYPHEFSGGQRQRICIAKALSLNPEVIVLDEPVSALDVSVQAQILNLLRSLQARMGLTYVFIGHGLGAVHYLSHRIAVMYRGRIVEEGASDTLFTHPAHPYTRALTDAAPSADYALRGRRRVALQGEVDTEAGREGCALYRRCPYRTEDCLSHSPVPAPVRGDRSHLSACVRALED